MISHVMTLPYLSLNFQVIVTRKWMNEINTSWSNKSCTREECMQYVAWPTCCWPILVGGLISIIDLMLAGFALRTRWLWLQHTGAERSWAQLQIDVEPEVRAFFSASVTVQVGNGESTLFWLHAWIQGRSFAFYKAGYVDKKNSSRYSSLL